MEIVTVKAIDFCCFEEVELNLSGQGLVYVVGDHRDSDASSSNGVGKSTLFKLVSWALYGQTVDNMRGDEVIRLGQKETVVSLTLSVSNNSWEIIRSRRKGAPRLSLRCNGAEMKDDGTEVQEKIVSLMGLDFRSFKNTVLYGQNDINKFADPKTKDADRKDMLHHILRTEELKKAYESAKRRALSYKKQITEIERELEITKQKSSMLAVEELKGRVSKWDDERFERLQTLREQHTQAQHEAEKLVGAEEIKTLEKEIEILRSSRLKRLSQIEDRAHCLDTKIFGKREELLNSQARYKELDTNLLYAKDKMAHLEAETCPVCSTPLNLEYPKQLKKERARTIEVMTEDLKLELIRHEELKNDLNAMEAEKIEVSDGLRELEKSRADLRQMEETLRKKQRQSSERKRWVDRVENYAERIKEVISEVNPYKEQLVSAERKYKEFRERLDGLRKQLRVLIEELSYVQFWVKGYSSQGMPSFLLDAVMPFLTERSNEYLKTLSGGDITVDISTQRELKSKAGVKDEINIQWSVEGNANVKKSGGQQTRVNLAVDLALMDLASTREGVNLNLMMIDEALDGLDRAGTACVLNLLKDLRKSRQSIFVVSHNDDMADMFEKEACVVRENGVSWVIF